jgi:hypothetical protein
MTFLFILFNRSSQMTPDVLVQWMAFAHIWEVTGSNLDPNAGYPALGFIVVFSVSPVVFQDATLSYDELGPPSFHFLSNSYLPLILS